VTENGSTEKKTTTVKARLRQKCHGKNGFVTATTLGTTDKIFVAATKNVAAATKTFC